MNSVYLFGDGFGEVVVGFGQFVESGDAACGELVFSGRGSLHGCPTLQVCFAMYGKGY